MCLYTTSMQTTRIEKQIDRISDRYNSEDSPTEKARAALDIAHLFVDLGTLTGEVDRHAGNARMWTDRAKFWMAKVAA